MQKHIYYNKKEHKLIRSFRLLISGVKGI